MHIEPGQNPPWPYLVLCADARLEFSATNLQTSASRTKGWEFVDIAKDLAEIRVSNLL